MKTNQDEKKIIIDAANILYNAALQNEFKRQKDLSMDKDESSYLKTINKIKEKVEWN